MLLSGSRSSTSALVLTLPCVMAAQQCSCLDFVCYAVWTIQNDHKTLQACSCTFPTGVCLLIHFSLMDLPCSCQANRLHHMQYGSCQHTVKRSRRCQASTKQNTEIENNNPNIENKPEDEVDLEVNQG